MGFCSFLKSWCISWFFLGFLVLSVNGYPVEDLIEQLPGQPKVAFRQFSGYIDVDVKAGRSLFYYFVEAEGHANHKPLTLWLNGGPGCSSIGGGAFTELGPFFPTGDGRGLRRNPKSWNKASNLLFVESPAGVGWSYSNTSSDYTCGDASTAMDMHEFMMNWYEKFPEFKSRDLFLTGESYAGHYIPQLAVAMLDHNKYSNAFKFKIKGVAVKIPSIFEDMENSSDGAVACLHISFFLNPRFQYEEGFVYSDNIRSGVMKVIERLAPNVTFAIEATREIGNPLLRLDTDIPACYEYFWSHGMISDETGLAIMNDCNFDDYTFSESHNVTRSCTRAIHDANKAVGDYINQYDVILDVCYPSIVEQELRLRKLATKISIGVDVCMTYERHFYLNLPQVQHALHANRTNLPYSWSMCSRFVNYSDMDASINILPLLKRIVKNGIPVWVFSGDQDSVVPLMGSRTLVRELAGDLNFKITMPYSAWFHKGQVGGWVTEYGNLLTFATVRGASHMVPYAQPARALVLFKAFLDGKRLPNTTHPSIG